MMKLLHGTWIPDSKNDFIREGSFFLWVETSEENQANSQRREHPFTLPKKALLDFIIKVLATGKEYTHSSIEPLFFTLPANDGEPFKSYELMKYTGEEVPEKFTLQAFRIESCKIPLKDVIKTLNELHFQLLFGSGEIMMATDLLFWFHYTQSLKEVILKDQYIPYLKYKSSPMNKSKIDYNNDFEIYPFWKIVSEKYENNLRKYLNFIPQICLGGAQEYTGGSDFFSAEPLLRHFSENILREIIRNTKFTPKIQGQVKGTILDYFLNSYKTGNIIAAKDHLSDLYKKWFIWKDKIQQSHTQSKFYLCFQLEEGRDEDALWNVNLLIEAKNDPSLKIPLHDYWYFDSATRAGIKKTFGNNLEKDILLNLGQAARIYSKIWESLETDKPSSFQLTLEEAFDFLKEKAITLDDSGYKVIVPAWWTPQGRKKAKLRLTASSPVTKIAGANNKLFTTETLIKYQYQLAIGNEEVSESEWRELVNAKTPLVKFHGQWVELDKEIMLGMLETWRSSAKKEKEMSLLELIKLSAEENKFQIEHDKTLLEMMMKLRDKTKFELSKTPKKFNGTLREYQQRGVSWIQFLEKIGINGCLADDMGLGKTIQVIARLINEREEKIKDLAPTLLIAPTSVLGNWQVEIAKFAPQFKALIHHGSKRLNDPKKFTEAVTGYDVIITSYSLIKKDEDLLKQVNWQRIVIDEAQNIKNPKAAQTRSLLQLKAKYRLALTGTPVENRLLDLWSIFNFLNHGYLDTHTAFRKKFEIPVQKENDRNKALMLKKLVEPFILRRLKTDKSIIRDLPDKVEQIIHCNLTKEQGSLYEAVVKDIEKQLEEKEGIERKGLILASLMRLKQICNHPLQFLQDNSDFSTERSHKLARLIGMLEEIMTSGESLLIFSQFKEICEQLDKFIREKLYYKTYLLHGGTGRSRRQKMIEEFQNPETDPAVFILSLKAGGVGINLTRANHVFHFDRWWNPAVEEQATDRAFRIGQEKNVFVHKFLAIGTLEEKINQLIEDKRKLSGSIIGSDESWLSELDNDSFKKLIALNKNAVME